MAEVYGWAVKDEDGNDIADVSVRGDTVQLEFAFSGGSVYLTPKEARELSRDLSAAAKVAVSK